MLFRSLLKGLFNRCAVCGKPGNPDDGTLKVQNGVYMCPECCGEGNPTTAASPRKNTKRGWNELVSPKDFESFIGQEPIKSELNTILKATKKHGIPVQHVLFSGNFGLGKTTLANIFASMIGKHSYVTAVNIRDESELPRTQVVVVDEVHTIRDEEWLLTVMDKGEQTILGATTTAGSLSGPLRSRFVSLVLEPYSVDELQRMVVGAANNLGYNCPDYVSHEVARRGKTVARIALFLFKRVYDRIILNDKIVTPELLQGWFESMKIDADGLDNADRAYIGCLSDRPIGIQNLTAMTGMDKLTIEESVEPYLLTHGFVKRTPRGRILGDRQIVGVWN